MLACEERWGAGEDERPFLPRAMSFLAAADSPFGARAGMRLSFMFEDVGPGTRRLGELCPGDGLWITGPLGNGFELPPGPCSEQGTGPRALLVGGGVGIPPLAAWAGALAAHGVAASALLGFRDEHHAEAALLLADADVATDDGSIGHHGLVTELLAAQLDGGGGDAVVYSCGPPAMLEAVRALCRERDVPAQLALEAGMACGFGACYGCVVGVREGGYVRICVDGPVLDAARVERVPEDAH
jgi:NAD(P)H-flavin reductase